MTMSSAFLKFIPIFLLSVTYVFSIKCPEVKFKDCGSEEGKVLSVAYNGTCDEGIVVLERGTNAGFRIDFTAGESVLQLKTVVHGIIKGIPLPFHVDQPDACKSLNATCPLKKGGNYEYKTVIPVKKRYPEITLVVEWELKDQNGKDVVCISIPAEIKP